MRHVRSPAYLLPLLALGCLAAPQAWGMSLAPGLFMVQNLKPGDEIDLRKWAGIVFTVKNDRDQAEVYSLATRKPSAGGLAQWEEGYGEIPDPAWCKLEKEQVMVPAQGSVEVGMTIRIPNQPEHYNGKWILAVVLTAGSKPGIGVGLALAARVQIETQSSAEKAATGLAALSVIPGTVQVTGAPGAEFKASALLRNSGASAYACAAERLAQVYPDAAKHARYASSGYQALVTESWLKPVAPFSLDAGAERALELSGTIPADAQPGARREELLFLRASSEPAAKAAPSKPQRTFLRVRYEVAGAAQENGKK